jgi:hypothetical protein
MTVMHLVGKCLRISPGAGSGSGAGAGSSATGAAQQTHIAQLIVSQQSDVIHFPLGR